MVFNLLQLLKKSLPELNVMMIVSVFPVLEIQHHLSFVDTTLENIVRL